MKKWLKNRIREWRVRRLARVISTSAHFSTAAAYEDFVTRRRK